MEITIKLNKAAGLRFPEDATHIEIKTYNYKLTTTIYYWKQTSGSYWVWNPTKSSWVSNNCRPAVLHEVLISKGED